MRINILSHPRSGSNYLYDIITKSYPDHICYFEPNRISKNNKIIEENIKSTLRLDNIIGWDYDNIITKNHCYHDQPPGNWHVIKIIRKNLFESSLSFSLGLTSKNFILNKKDSYIVEPNLFKWSLNFLYDNHRKIKSMPCDKLIYYENLTFCPNTDLLKLGIKNKIEIKPISKMEDKKYTILNYNELREIYEKTNIPSIYWEEE